MQSLTQIADALGRKELCSRLGISQSALFNALAAGQFPSGWFDIMMTLAQERRVVVPYESFSWRKPTEKVE